MWHCTGWVQCSNKLGLQHALSSSAVSCTPVSSVECTLQMDVGSVALSYIGLCFYFCFYVWRRGIILRNYDEARRLSQPGTSPGLFVEMFSRMKQPRAGRATPLTYHCIVRPS